MHVTMKVTAAKSDMDAIDRLRGDESRSKILRDILSEYAHDKEKLLNLFNEELEDIYEEENTG